MNIETSGNISRIKINPKVYDLDTVYSAAYVFLDRAYIMLDGNPDDQIEVMIESKNQSDSETISKEFLNELISYGDYSRRSKNTEVIREAILQRALVTNDPSITDRDDQEFNEFLKDLEKEELDDPDDIAVPWEELDNEVRSD